MPEKTLLALAEHGVVESTLAQDGGNAEAVIGEFVRAGVDDAALAAQLQREGAQSFAESWNDLMECIASKSTELMKSPTGTTRL